MHLWPRIHQKEGQRHAPRRRTPRILEPPRRELRPVDEAPREAMPRMLELIGEAVRGSKRVLELGAGNTTGHARSRSRSASRRGHRLFEQHGGHLEDRIRSAHIDNVECQQSDIYALEFDPGSFDAVLPANVLHLVPDMAIEALRGRVLIPHRLRRGGSADDAQPRCTIRCPLGPADPHGRTGATLGRHVAATGRRRGSLGFRAKVPPPGRDRARQTATARGSSSRTRLRPVRCQPRTGAPSAWAPVLGSRGGVPCKGPVMARVLRRDHVELPPALR